MYHGCMCSYAHAECIIMSILLFKPLTVIYIMIHISTEFQRLLDESEYEDLQDVNILNPELWRGLNYTF